MENKLVSTLTEIFLSLRDYASLRLWYDDGGLIRYHLTNNPPKSQNNDFKKTHSPVPAQEIPPEGNLVTRTTRKRRRPVEPAPSPEISRDACLNAGIDEILSDIEPDRDVSITSVPCSNRFDALEDDSSGSAPLADIEGQANDDQFDTNDVEESNLEISNALVASPSQNRLCCLCKTVRVSESYHVRCADCFSKHGLRYVF